MDLRRLRYFVAVAEELHFGRAAERVGIAQPPLTQQIQKLENELDCRLLVRGRKTALTEAGAALLEQARRLLEQAERAAEITRRAARGEQGQLVVGAPPSVMLAGLPAAIRKYRQLYPGVQFTLGELSTSAIENAVRSGEIDVGFLRETRPDAPLASEIMYQEPVVAVLPATHPMAGRRTLALAALRREPFIFFPRRLGPAFYDRLIAFCSQAGFVPDIVQEATQWQSVVCLVEAEMGVSLAPGCVQRFGWKGVMFHPLRGSVAAPLRTSVTACWRQEAPSSTAAAFLKLCRAEFRQPAG